jgi:ubiquinone/menaquinone biosynthesis C-methylase UbiE
MRHRQFEAKKIADKLLSAMRYSRVFKCLPELENANALDLGAGKGVLVDKLREKNINAFGVDVQPSRNVVVSDLNNPLPFKNNSIDIVTSLANIEHLSKPEVNSDEIYRILKKGGRLILTTPMPMAKPILEFLAFKLGVIDRLEIEDHKQYFSKKTLTQLLQDSGFNNISFSYFQFGLNGHVVAIK